MNGRNLVLIGFMGTGKSSVGRLCAQRLGYTFRDSDAVIEEHIGCAIPQFFTEQGEEAFRRIEHEVITELAAASGLVIATGGGAVMNENNVAALRSTGCVVLLTATPIVILRRVGNTRSRPLLASASDPLARIKELLAAREPFYTSAAHIQVNTSLMTREVAADKIVELYREFEV